jgi:hypothetical protein
MPASGPAGPATRFVFIKGDHNPYNTFRTDNWRQTHNTTDSGPVYRPGRNLYVLDVSAGRNRSSTPLTTFADGYVADVNVSYDGNRCSSPAASRRSLVADLRMHADGGGLRQLTRGPYHHVSPNYLPDGRIVFSTTRLGTRDEYHGYPCTGWR